MLAFSPATTVMDDSFELAKASVELTVSTSAEIKVLVVMLVVFLFYLVAQMYSRCEYLKSITTPSPNESNKIYQNEYSIFILVSLLPNQILKGSNRILSSF